MKTKETVSVTIVILPVKGVTAWVNESMNESMNKTYVNRQTTSWHIDIQLLDEYLFFFLF